MVDNIRKAALGWTGAAEVGMVAVVIDRALSAVACALAIRACSLRAELDISQSVAAWTLRRSTGRRVSTAHALDFALPLDVVRPAVDPPAANAGGFVDTTAAGGASAFGNCGPLEADF